MKLSSEFLKSLQQKLAVESRRGVHLNAIPGRSRLKFDVQRLALFQAELPQDFLDTLLTEPVFDFPISLPKRSTPSIELEKAVRHLNMLQYEVEDILLEKGIHTFGFGYPLVIYRSDDAKWVVAPLLIWSLQIRKNRKEAQWVLRRTEEDAVVINEVLLRYLHKETAVILDGLQDWISEDGLVTAEQVEEMVHYFLEKMEQTDFANAKNKRPSTPLENELFGNGLQQIPARNSLLKKKGMQLQFQQGGLFAVFEVRHQNLLRDYDCLLANNNLVLDLEASRGMPTLQLSTVTTDPAQQSVLDTLSVKKSMLIHGPPGTGKSQTLTAIIVNALRKGQKTLMVCGKQTALQVILDHLEKLELDHLVALVKDVKKDRRKVVNKVRQMVDDRSFYAGEGTLFATNEFESTVEKGINSLMVKEAAYTFYGKEIWGNYTFGDLVALMLETLKEIGVKRFVAHRLIDKEKLNYEDWQSMSTLLERGEVAYYAALPFLGLYHLASFSGGTFTDFVSRFEQRINQLKVLTEAIEQDRFTFEKETHKYFSKKYEQVYYRLHQQIELVYNYLSKPNQNRKSTVNVLTKEQATGLQYFNQLCDFMAAEEGLAFEAYHSEKPVEALDQLNELKSTINDWRRSWSSEIQRIIDGVDIKSRPEEFEHIPAYQTLQNALDHVIDSINEAKWFQEKIVVGSNITDTLETIQQRINQLNELQGSGLSELFEWASLFSQQPAATQNLLSAMEKERNWKAQYDAFVYSTILKKRKPPKIERTNDLSFNGWQEKLEKDQISFTQSLWRERQRVAAIRFQQQQRIDVAQFYNKRSTATQKKHTLRELVLKDLDLFQSFFPVVLATPESASLLFSEFGNQEIFDLVLFDEASQLKVEEGIPAMLKGRQKIVAGDEHQMPPTTYFGERSQLNNRNTSLGSITDTPSWLDFISSLPVAHQYLDFHYRSRHPQLIQFSNTAFYNDRLCPMPPQIQETPISFRMVNGQYADGLNKAEVDDVVLLLRKIERNEDGFYPSVGIATFNVKQRNLILEKLREEEIRSASFAAKIIGLREAGLFVKNLENIQGDERDLLIISTVYGCGENGKFSERFGPINQVGGYKLLNVLITRAKFKIIICCSIPERSFSHYNKLLQKHGNTRKGIFYAWLTYAKAVADSDGKLIQQVLTDLRQQQKEKLDESAPIAKERLFPTLVYERLKPKLNQGRLQQNVKLGGFSIDLFYEAPTGIPCLIICDGFNDKRITAAFGTHSGLRLIRIWSLDWWKNESKALKYLLQLLTLADDKNC